MSKTYTEMWIEAAKILGYDITTAKEVAETIGKDEKFLREVPPAINPFELRNK